MKKYIMHCKQKINLQLLIFAFFFSFYIFLGMLISYSVNFDANMFFGADNARAFLDLTEINYNHYRIKVHPLLLMFVHSIVKLFNGVFNNITLSLIFVEALTGSFSVYIFLKIMEKLKLDIKFCIIFCLIYGFSFSMMIFSSIPETFIFAGLGLILYWYFILLSSRKTGELSSVEKFLIVFFGILSFGITLTNYFAYLVGLFYLLYSRFYIEYNKKNIFLSFLKFNVINAFLIILLCAFQAMMWPNCPHFLTSIFEGLLGSSEYEEFLYMNFDVSLEKTIVWLQQSLLFPLFSPNITFVGSAFTWYQPILFTNYEAISIKCISVLFVCAFVCLIIINSKKVLKSDIKNRGFYISLLITLIFNLCLHYIYGSEEVFIYTPHFLYIFLLLGVVAIETLFSEKYKKAWLFVLVPIVFFQLFNNISAFLTTTQIALELKNMEMSFMTAANGYVVCFIMFLVCFIIYNYFTFVIESKQKNITLSKKLFQHSEKNFLNDMNNSEKTIEIFFNSIIVYLIIIIAICISIGFNY